MHIQVAGSDNSEFLAIAGRKLNLQLRCCLRLLTRILHDILYLEINLLHAKRGSAVQML